jgi:hypothetical protein
MSERPVDGVGQVEAARILACHRWTVVEYVKTGRLRSAGRNVRRGLSRADVEALACQVYPWWEPDRMLDALERRVVPPPG